MLWFIKPASLGFPSRGSNFPFLYSTRGARTAVHCGHLNAIRSGCASFSHEILHLMFTQHQPVQEWIKKALVRYLLYCSWCSRWNWNMLAWNLHHYRLLFGWVSVLLHGNIIETVWLHTTDSSHVAQDWIDESVRFPTPRRLFLWSVYQLCDSQTL